MKIPVIFSNGSHGNIISQDLDDLLKMKLITSFYRSSGWATVGRDELRSRLVEKNGSWKNRKINQKLLTM